MNKLKNISQHKKTAAKMTLRYVFSLVRFEVSYILLNLLFLYVMGITRLDQTKLFIAFKPWMLPLMFVVSIVGCIYISYRFMRKPLEYLHEVSGATKQLAHPTQAPIVLSSDLSDIQDNLNNVRAQALMDRQAVRDAERQKNDLLVYLAHDLKTPLTSVLGYLRLIEDEESLTPEMIAKYSGVARRKAERLDELINEFFTIARFTATKLTLEPAKVNLSRMLKQITFEFNPILKEKGLEWDLQIPDNIEIICDSDKLERTIDNLIRNAVNYSYENTTILCSMAQSPDSVRICIQNKGATIPPEKLKRIFEQFYRLDEGRSSNTGGAGLGLAIAKEIVELHHGTISAYSEDEVIKFIITLPNDCQKIV